jgi:hypothetical protein
MPDLTLLLKNKNDIDIDDLIIQLLKVKPLSTETLTILTGKRKPNLLKRLHQLEKYNVVQIAAKKETYWWKLKDS